MGAVVTQTVIERVIYDIDVKLGYYLS